MTKNDIRHLRTDGERGVQDLAKLARELGCRGACDQLQFSNGAFASDILALLEDNPCMIEGIYKIISENPKIYDYDLDEEEEEECGCDECEQEAEEH